MTDKTIPPKKMHHRSPDLLNEQAYQALIEKLRNGSLSSGTFLSMQMLVELLDRPIAAVRDAVKRAEASGLMEILPKKGVVVMGAGPLVTRECLELRMIFDCEGARQLIKNESAVDLHILREAHEDLLAEAIKGVTPELSKRAIKTDLMLHDALSKGIESKLTARLYEENRNRVAVIQNIRPYLSDRIISSMNEHLAIINALEQRDTNAAVEAVRNHLRHTLRWWGVED